MRRSGKTTLLFQIIDDLIHNRRVDPRSILFVNCDEPEIARLEDPLETLLETYRRDVYGGDAPYLIFDEIQTLEGWERWIKSLYDRKKFTLIISGSTSYLLDSNLSTLIAGRYLPVHVYPLDFVEYVVFSGEDLPHDPVSLASAKYRLLHLLGEYIRKEVSRRSSFQTTKRSGGTSSRHTTTASSIATSCGLMRCETRRRSAICLLTA